MYPFVYDPLCTTNFWFILDKFGFILFQDRYHGYRPCSRCSQSSSIVSNSPKFDKINFDKISSYQHSPASSHDSASRQGNSPSSGRTSVSQQGNSPASTRTSVSQQGNSPSSGRTSVSRQGNSPTSTRTSTQRSKSLCTTQAVIHRPPNEVLLDSDQNCSHSTVGRKNSLPEITSQPSQEARRIGTTGSPTCLSGPSDQSAEITSQMNGPSESDGGTEVMTQFNGPSDGHAEITIQSNGPSDGSTELISHVNEPSDKDENKEMMSQPNRLSPNVHPASLSKPSELPQR